MSIDANSNCTRSESVFTSGSRKPLSIGVGIANREGPGWLARNARQGWLVYWEPEMPPNGRTGCVVLLPEGVDQFVSDATHHLAIGTATPGKPFVYYFGAAWSKSGDFDQPEALEQYMRDFAARIESPLKVDVGGAR